MNHTLPIETNQGSLVVKRCGCGGIHICLGGISINLSQETAESLSSRLREVCQESRGVAEALDDAEGNPVAGFFFRRYTS